MNKKSLLIALLFASVLVAENESDSVNYEFPLSLPGFFEENPLIDTHSGKIKTVAVLEERIQLIRQFLQRRWVNDFFIWEIQSHKKLIKDALQDFPNKTMSDLAEKIEFKSFLDIQTGALQQDNNENIKKVIDEAAKIVNENLNRSRELGKIYSQTGYDNTDSLFTRFGYFISDHRTAFIVAGVIVTGYALYQWYKRKNVKPKDNTISQI